jgi:hypothetical protein
MRAEDQDAGRKASCPGCSKIITIPQKVRKKTVTTYRKTTERITEDTTNTNYPMKKFTDRMGLDPIAIIPIIFVIIFLIIFGSHPKPSIFIVGFIIFGIIVTGIIAFKRQKKINKFIKLMPDERILFEEKDVISVDNTAKTRQSRGYSQFKQIIKVTNKRILLFLDNNAPVKIIDYTSTEMPKETKFMRPNMFLIVDRENIILRTDTEGNKCIEISTKEGKIKYFIKNIDRLVEYFGAVNITAIPLLKENRFNPKWAAAIIFTIVCSLFLMGGLFLVYRWGRLFSFSEIEGRILEKRIKETAGDKGGMVFIPEIKYSFKLKNKIHIGDRYALNYMSWKSFTDRTTDFPAAGSRNWASSILEKYKIGSKITIYYDSANPKDCFLSRKFNWFILIFIAFPVLVLIIFFKFMFPKMR